MIIANRSKHGQIANALEPTASAATGEQLEFTWKNNSEAPKASDNDKTIMVAYCPENNQCILDFGTARRLQKDVLPVDPFAGKTIHTWFSFISKNGKYIANSIYTGEFLIPKS